MKNLLYKTIFGRDAKLTTLIAVCLLIFVVLGCRSSGNSSSSSKPIPPEYFGVWTGEDGSMITIRGDGKGDYKSGGTTVDGGTVEINDEKKELSITFFGIGPSKKIDSPPNGGEMKLNGVVYKRSGGGPTTSTDTKKPVADSSPTTSSSPKSVEKSDASLKEIPKDDELQLMVQTTLIDFNDAVQAADFTDFFPKISKIWQRESSPAQLKETFQIFIDRNIDIGEISTMEANITTKPRIDNTKGFDELLVEGVYDTSPTPTRFKLKYTPEGKDWKLTGISVDNTR